MGKQIVATYHDYTNGLTIPHPTDAEEAIGKARGAAVCLNLLFDVDIWNTFVVPYDFAVEHTVPFMQTKYLAGILDQMHRNVAVARQLLKVFLQNGATAFYLPGGVQYFNEIEKCILLSHGYNAGVGTLALANDRTKKFVHAVNTHDLRWLRLAWKAASVYASRKSTMQALLERSETMDLYDYTKTAL